MSFEALDRRARNASWPTKESKRPNQNRGFSLLEVIIATAIVAASSMIVLRLVSTGEAHFTRAERKSHAKRIGQSLIDQMLIGKQPLEELTDQPIDGYENWIFTTEVEPTDLGGVVRVRLRVAQKKPTEQRDIENTRYDFEAVRWMRAPQPSDDQGASRGEDLP